MIVFILGIAFFAFAFVVHIVVWRVWRPRATAQALIVVMVSSIISITIVIVLSANAASWPEATTGEIAESMVMALALAAAYVMTYPAMEIESPTLVIIDLVWQAGNRGSSYEELRRKLDDDFLVIARIDDMVREGLVKFHDGRYRLAQKGWDLGKIYLAWRRLLDAGQGG